MSANPQIPYEQLTSTPELNSCVVANDAMSNTMEHILQAMPSGVVIINGDGIVTQANPVALQLLGQPLMGMKWLQIINRAFSPQDDDGHEVSLKNGRRVKLAITPLTPEPGQLIVLTDLTETRLLQKNISHLQRLSALGKMVASLAHQVRTPLSAALLYASNLASPKLTQEHRVRFQSKLIDRLNELSQQVDDMLLMAKGKQQELTDVAQMTEVVDAVVANCEPIAQRKGCQLQLDVSSNLSFQANKSALSSAINNLVINSVEAGATQVLIRAYDQSQAIHFEVIDNGKGLDKSMQAQVFEPFFTTKAQGTGLGLAVVQTVVNNHSGRLKLDCIKGEGCRASFALPALNVVPSEALAHG
ncbi:ATP-binding protein [Shewanella sp. Isolate11]|uniref:sensor histidine kinase n=1 Tax=Shewanella sp. Isolate11 TaxID=2908530 RepID=UPI001EFDBC04|nr:ATP-binding protein [Shewanella sp. Isolate11]MCG9697155.1 ATP-binding protein [Shewanella sp. Isolate11]